MSITPPQIDDTKASHENIWRWHNENVADQRWRRPLRPTGGRFRFLVPGHSVFSHAAAPNPPRPHDHFPWLQLQYLCHPPMIAIGPSGTGGTPKVPKTGAQLAAVACHQFQIPTTGAHPRAPPVIKRILPKSAAASLTALLVATMGRVKYPDQGNTGLVLERAARSLTTSVSSSHLPRKRAADSGRSTDSGTVGRKLRRLRRPVYLSAGQ